MSNRLRGTKTESEVLGSADGQAISVNNKYFYQVFFVIKENRLGSG